MKKKNNILFAIVLYILYFPAFAQYKDTVFVKYNNANEGIKYKTDTVIFPSSMRRNMIMGTSIWPSSSNQYVAYYQYGLNFQKVESSDCSKSIMEYDPADTRINSVTLHDSLLTIDINITGNCCYSFLCDIKVEQDSILQLQYFGYGANHCDCECCFGLTYKIKQDDLALSKKIKYVMIADVKRTLKKIPK